MGEKMDLLNLNQICDLIPFRRAKVLKLLRQGIIPATKVGRDYLSTREEIVSWVKNNIGGEIFYD